MIQVIQGDCVTELSKFPDESIDLIVTDPPYGMNYVSGKQNLDTRQNRKGEKKHRQRYFTAIPNDTSVPIEWLPGAYRVLRTGGAAYIFCRWSGLPALYTGLENAGFRLKNLIVARKSNHGMGDLRGSYAPCHELILFAVKGAHKLRWPQGRTRDVWDVRVPYSGSRRPHPNYKPKEWVYPAILNSSDEGDTVLDPFCGSGSFLRAASELGRYAVGIDLHAPAL